MVEGLVGERVDGFAVHWTAGTVVDRDHMGLVVFPWAGGGGERGLVGG